MITNAAARTARSPLSTPVAGILGLGGPDVGVGAGWAVATGEAESGVVVSEGSVVSGELVDGDDVDVLSGTVVSGAGVLDGDNDVVIIEVVVGACVDVVLVDVDSSSGHGAGREICAWTDECWPLDQTASVVKRTVRRRSLVVKMNASESGWE